ncbi:MAG: hypothetical protein EHM85_04450 [Desulfobacteraceae bacterium]|nr:MAG: hypothetical protein EHM85_04450 [Desulfobacteraceae bacterium]
MEGLKTGVDNVRCDVHLSDGLHKTAHNFVLLFLAKHTRAEEILNLDKSVSLSDEKEQFKRLSTEVLIDAVNKAKLRDQPVINTLAQVAVIKLLLKEIRDSYDNLLDIYGNAVREYQIASELEKAISMKNQLSNLTQQKNILLCAISREIFQSLSEIYHQGLNEIIRSNFGDEAIIPDDVFLNPLLFAENPSDNVFMIEEYDILIEYREEDPDKYQALKDTVSKAFSEINDKDGAKSDETFREKVNEWIGSVDNVDILFNHFQTLHLMQQLKKKKGDKKQIKAMKEEAVAQEKRLDFFYKKFRQEGFMQRIAALYEMRLFYSEYCPPLVPQVIVQYMIVPSSRKAVRQRLKRLRGFYGKTLSSEKLDMAAMRYKKIGNRVKKAYLIRFLKAFFRYHHDFQCAEMLRNVINTINLVTEEKIIRLSKANNTLYEFLLNQEQDFEEKPIIRHVIIKADVRGSTDITHRMIERKLNPASYFSLNLFDPITKILGVYDASKVFVEGDAIILSVFEHEETPEGWYSVARACGLAMKMRSIVQQYNTRNQEYQLPIIEIGIGISFKDGAPLFLFDGSNRIMISSAINLADRLSGCSSAVRKKSELGKGHFNLYVFQTLSEEEMSKTADDLFLRYNVNGIELNPSGFKKLAQEIAMKSISATTATLGTSERNTFYVGKFPTVHGQYQSLVIREAPVPQINPDTFEIIKITHRNYYEVCTNPKICEQVMNTLK